MKILVADDDPVSRKLMESILNSAQAGYILIMAEDGTQAWAAMEANADLKLVILDLTMPGLTGLELLDRMRADERLAQLPVIICTGDSDRSTVTAVAARGIRNFLVKPFTRTTVLEKVFNIYRPQTAAVPVVRDLAAARQRFEIDRDTHRELLAYFVRIADMWATDARRTNEFARVRALAIRAGNLRQMLGGLGAAAVAARFQEAEDALLPYRVKPLAQDLPACLRKAQQFGEKIQADVDRLRETLDTLT